MRVVSWNLFHGRAEPSAGRPLLHEFATTLRGWSWDVALLQEVPPWWPPLLARACGPDAVVAAIRTSRTAALPVRRALSARRPDLLKANGGGANAILLRGGLRRDAHARLRLRLTPERRWVHAVRLVDPRGGAWDGTWVGNVHGQKGAWDEAPGLRRPLADLRRAVAALERWDAGNGAATAGERPILLGGDLNLPRDAVSPALPAGWVRIASSGPDHVVGRNLGATAASTRPERRGLSDHAALAVDVGPRATIGR